MNGEKINGNKHVTWLHLSDAHLGNLDGWDAERILSNLLTDFRDLQNQYLLKPDMIFFTGDAVFGHMGESGMKSITGQFKAVEELFEKIRQAFNPAVPKENFFIVPGNHDVNRSEVIPHMHFGFDSGMPNDYHKVEKKLSSMIRDNNIEWRSFMNRLNSYRDFLEANGYYHLLQDPDRLIYGVKRVVNGVTLGIGGFNSAWSSYADKEKGNLWLAGHFQVEQVLKNIGDVDLTIGLMHHPPGWFNPVEDPAVKREIGNHFDIFLHGHDHADWVEPFSEKCRAISAGACYGELDSEMGYNLTRWYPVTGDVQIRLRKYDKSGGGWIPRILHKKTNNGGVWKFQLRQPSPANSRIMEGFASLNTARITNEEQAQKNGTNSDSESNQDTPFSKAAKDRFVYTIISDKNLIELENIKNPYLPPDEDMDNKNKKAFSNIHCHMWLYGAQYFDHPPLHPLTTIAAVCSVKPHQIVDTVETVVGAKTFKKIMMHPSKIFLQDQKKWEEAISKVVLPNSFVAAISIPEVILGKGLAGSNYAFQVICNVFLKPLLEMHQRFTTKQFHMLISKVGEKKPTLIRTIKRELKCYFNKRGDTSADFVRPGSKDELLTNMARFVAWSLGHNSTPGIPTDLPILYVDTQ